jgi:glucose-6-phosphate isomerase
MIDEDAVLGLLASEPSLFEGDTATHALGWLRHPERYLGAWLDNVADLIPRRHERTLVLGMGGSSSAARLYAESRPLSGLAVLDTSNPDTVASTDFSGANVIASSKSGGTIETRTLLAHALDNGLEPQDLVVITDPGTTLEGLGYSLGAIVVVGDPDTGGRFAGLSAFGLVPALYAGWSVDELRAELAHCMLTHELCVRAVNHADDFACTVRDGSALFALGADPITSGGALWLEQLVAETTGKSGRGFIPVIEGRAQEYVARDMMYWQLVAALLARHLGVDPFNQPDVESAKNDVFALLEDKVSWTAPDVDEQALHAALAKSNYVALQVYAPLDVSESLVHLRSRVEAAYGPTTANLGPRYLHSTGQLHKGGPTGVVGVQIVQRPTSTPVRIAGRGYSFHDLHMAQAQSDLRAMRRARRLVWQLVVDDLDEAALVLGLQS